jgi:RNA polymerase sigma factor (sigma-70 family)
VTTVLVAGQGHAAGSDRTVDSASSGRPELSLNDLYVSERKQLVRLAAMLVGNVASAEDIVQEAFVRVSIRHADGWDSAYKLGYLRTTVVNLSRSVLRRRLIAARHLPRAGHDHEAADAGAMQASERSTVIAMLQKLPRRQREVLALRYYDDLSLAEIATVMNVSLGTVKSTLFKATAACAALMRDPR